MQSLKSVVFFWDAFGLEKAAEREAVIFGVKEKRALFFTLVYTTLHSTRCLTAEIICR